MFAVLVEIRATTKYVTAECTHLAQKLAGDGHSYYLQSVYCLKALSSTSGPCVFYVLSKGGQLHNVRVSSH